MRFVSGQTLPRAKHIRAGLAEDLRGKSAKTLLFAEAAVGPQELGECNRLSELNRQHVETAMVYSNDHLRDDAGLRPLIYTVPAHALLLGRFLSLDSPSRVPVP